MSAPRKPEQLSAEDHLRILHAAYVLADRVKGSTRRVLYVSPALAAQWRRVFTASDRRRRGGSGTPP